MEEEEYVKISQEHIESFLREISNQDVYRESIFRSLSEEYHQHYEARNQEGANLYILYLLKNGEITATSAELLNGDTACEEYNRLQKDIYENNLTSSTDRFRLFCLEIRCGSLKRYDSSGKIEFISDAKEASSWIAVLSLLGIGIIVGGILGTRLCHNYEPVQGSSWISGTCKMIQHVP